MKDAIYFDDYETISDLLLFLGSGCSLRMCVTIGGKTKDNVKVNLSTEYQYRTNKYIDRDKLISVKRRFFPYLAIEYKDQGEILGKGMIKITHYDILGFRDKISEVDRLLENCFAIKNGKLIITANKNFKITSRPSDGTISFSPTIIIYQDESQTPGIRMVINDRIYTDFSIKVWKAFMYYIHTADLYGWAAAIVSGYTQNTIGSNVQDMTNISKDPTLGDEFNDEIGFKNTKPISKDEKRKSFFDD